MRRDREAPGGVHSQVRRRGPRSSGRSRRSCARRTAGSWTRRFEPRSPTRTRACAPRPCAPLRASPPPAHPPTSSRRSATPTPPVRAEAAFGLGQLADAASLPRLLEAAKDADTSVRAAVADALGKIHDPSSTDAMSALLDDGDPGVRANARLACWKYADPSFALDRVIRTASSDAFLEYSAAYALARLSAAGLEPASSGAVPGRLLGGRPGPRPRATRRVRVVQGARDPHAGRPRSLQAGRDPGAARPPEAPDRPGHRREDQRDPLPVLPGNGSRKRTSSPRSIRASPRWSSRPRRGSAVSGPARPGICS